MQNSMAIGAYNFTFLYLLFNPIKAYGSSKTADREELILVFFMVKIKDAWIRDTTSSASSRLLVFI